MTEAHVAAWGQAGPSSPVRLVRTFSRQKGNSSMFPSTAMGGTGIAAHLASKLKVPNPVHQRGRSGKPDAGGGAVRERIMA